MRNGQTLLDQIIAREKQVKMYSRVSQTNMYINALLLLTFLSLDVYGQGGTVTVSATVKIVPVRDCHLLSSWLPDIMDRDHCCSQTEVACIDDKVIELRLKQRNINGTFPPNAYFDLFMNRLKVVDLSWNNLTGPIPEGLFKQPEMTHLSLNMNNLTGPVPSMCGPAVQRINLIGNRFLKVNESGIGHLKNNPSFPIRGLNGSLLYTG